MTVNDKKPVSGPHIADGVNRQWPFDYRLVDQGHMSIVVQDADGLNSQTFTGNISVSSEFLRTDQGGYAVYPVTGLPVESGKRVFAVRNVPYSQPQRIGNQGTFYPLTHEDTFDLISMQVQQAKELIDRSVKAEVGGDGLTISPGPLGSVPVYDAFGNLSTSIQAGSIATSEFWGRQAREWAVSTELVDDGVNAPNYSSRQWALYAETKSAEAQDVINNGLNLLLHNSIVIYFLTGELSVPLGASPGSKNNVSVVQGGVIQSPSTYELQTIGGVPTIIFSEPAAADGWIVFGGAIEVNTPSDKSVTFAKMQDIASLRLMGRATAGSGNPEELTVAQVRTMLGLGPAPGAPMFQAYPSANQTLTNSTMTKVQCNTENFDPQGCFDNVTNFRFTPNVAGIYRVKGTVAGTGTSVTQVIAAIYKNGSLFHSVPVNPSAAQSSALQSTAELLVAMNGTTDYLELFAQISATSGWSVVGATPLRSFFEAYRVGP